MINLIFRYCNRGYKKVSTSFEASAVVSGAAVVQSLGHV